MNPMGRAGEVGMRRDALSTRVTGSVAGHDERRLWSTRTGMQRVVLSFPVETGKLRPGEVVSAPATTWGARPPSLVSSPPHAAEMQRQALQGPGMTGLKPRLGESGQSGWPSWK